MKIIRTLKVTKDEFYDCLEENLLKTINKDSTQLLTSKDIKKGLKYSKNVNDVYARSDFTILEYQRGELYKAKTKSMTDSIVLTYNTKQTENGLKVTFEQNILSHETRKQSKLMKSFSELVFLSRMSNSLYDMQRLIFNKREGIVETEVHPSMNPLIKKLISKKRNSN